MCSVPAAENAVHHVVIVHKTKISKIPAVDISVPAYMHTSNTTYNNYIHSRAYTYKNIIHM